MRLIILLILCVLTVGLQAQLIPFVNCTINQGGTCITTWGYTNNYPTTVVLPLFINQFSPAPVFRGQPTVFSASSTIFKAFNTTRLCSSGNLTWSLTDPFTNVVHHATTTNTTGNACSPLPPVTINCLNNNTRAANRLQLCESHCGSQCSYCGQVYSYCKQVGLISANFTLDNCIIINLDFNPVSGGCNYQQVLNGCCQNIGPPIAPPVPTPISPPLPPPPTTPYDTAVCSFGFYKNAYNCMINNRLSTNCTERTATCQDLLLTIGNNTESDDCILFNLGGSSDASGDCNFVSSVNSCCGTLPAGNISCTSQANCPVNYVCTTNPGMCSGIQGASCGMNQLCSNAYNCTTGTCTNSASDSFQSAIVNQCASAPTLECNTTASIALQESNTLGTGLSCNNPSTAYLGSSLIGYFYLPATNATFDSFNNTFTIYNPSFASLSVRVLLPCGANFCDRELTPVSLPPGLISYNDIIDYNVPGIVRGYALIVPGSLAGIQLPPLNGIIVNVTTQCLQNVPIPPSPSPTPLGPPIPPQPPTHCKDDSQCECNFCCQTGDCVQCPIRCTVNPCPQGLYCTSLKYCTTNRICQGLENMMTLPRKY